MMLRFASSSNSLVLSTDKKRAGHVKLSDPASKSLINALKSGDPQVQGLLEQLDGFQKNTARGHGRDSTHQLVEQLGDNTSQMRTYAVTKRLQQKLNAQQMPQMQEISPEIITQARALAAKVDANELPVADYVEEMKKLGFLIQLHPDEESPATETIDGDKGKSNEGADTEKKIAEPAPKTEAQIARAKRKKEKYKANLKTRKAAEQAKQANAGDSKSNPFVLKETTSASEESS